MNCVCCIYRNNVGSLIIDSWTDGNQTGSVAIINNRRKRWQIDRTDSYGIANIRIIRRQWKNFCRAFGYCSGSWLVQNRCIINRCHINPHFPGHDICSVTCLVTEYFQTISIQIWRIGQSIIRIDNHRTIIHAAHLSNGQCVIICIGIVQKHRNRQVSIFLGRHGIQIRYGWNVRS